MRIDGEAGRTAGGPPGIGADATAPVRPATADTAVRVGAIAAAALVRPRPLAAPHQLRTTPLELLPLNDPSLLVPARPAGDPAAGLAGSAGQPDPTATRAARPRAAAIAGAVQWMSVGALVALGVMWGAGTFDPPEPVEVVVEPATREDLPMTGAEALAQAAAATPAPAAEPAPAEAAAPDLGPPQLPNPSQVEIPAIGVSARIIPLGTLPTGELDVPQDFAQTGWWTGGPEPGEQGPAVIVGHVDSFQGPAVFFALEQLAYDDAIVVTRADGSQATFAVRTLTPVDKASFPTELAYGMTAGPELRLITCDGDFADGSYLGNLIVSAVLVAETPAPSTGALAT